MNRPRRLIQAYRQAPWRRQVQWIGLFSAAVVFVAVVAGVYLNVTARAATAGREIQLMQEQKQEIQQQIEDLETQVAYLTSARVMEKRAEELGFEPISRDQVLYLVVPGYPGRQPAKLAPPPGSKPPGTSALPPEFTQSLIDWARQSLDRLFAEYGAPLREVVP